MRKLGLAVFAAVWVWAAFTTCAKADDIGALDWCVDTTDSDSEFRDCLNRYAEGVCETDAECIAFFGGE